MYLMDQRTLSYYSKNARDVFERYDSFEGGLSEQLGELFPPGSKVLDIGTGSGRDVRLLLEAGCDAYGVEPCDELRHLAARKYPELSKRLAKDMLPFKEPPFGGRFDGVLCSAVLMHVPKEEIFDSAFSIKRALKPGGRALFSIPLERPDIDPTGRDLHGRLFTGLKPGYLELLCERLGFRLLRKWENTYRGKGGLEFIWVNMLFQLTDSKQLRPIDRIEAVFPGKNSNRSSSLSRYN